MFKDLKSCVIINNTERSSGEQLKSFKQSCEARMKKNQKNFHNHTCWSSQFSNTYSVLLKEELMHHCGEHAPVATFLKHHADIEFKFNKTLGLY